MNEWVDRYIERGKHGTEMERTKYMEFQGESGHVRVRGNAANARWLN